MSFRLFVEAVKVMPEEYVDDQTQTMGIGGNYLVAVNPNHPPIIYNPNDGVWYETGPVDESIGHAKH